MSQRRDDNAQSPARDSAQGPSQNAGVGPNGPIPADLVDRFFDGELDEAARREFLRALPRDLDTCEEVAKTRRMLDMLKSGGGSMPLAAPDLTGRIIARVDKQRGFASRHVRQLARVARLAVAAGLVLVVGAIAAVERVAPDATRLAPAPTPLTSAFRQTQEEVTSNLGSLASAVETIQERLAPPPLEIGERVRAGRFTARDGAPRDGVEIATMISVSTGEARGHRESRAPMAARAVAVSFRMSPKGAGHPMVWTMDMAPETPAAPSRPALPARFIDAEGRCAAFVMPLGIGRVGSDDAAPFVLPVQNVAPTPRPAELLTTRSGSGLR